jgi:hypothetical protein
VSLNPLLEQIARIAFALPEAGQVALAGGGAMLAHDLVDRPTQDVDLFTPGRAEVTRLTTPLAVALRAEGAQVQVDRRGPAFTRVGVTVADGRSVVVEIAQQPSIAAKRKQPLRMVAAESPDLRRVETHFRTIALVILLSGAEPK